MGIAAMARKPKASPVTAAEARERVMTQVHSPYSHGLDRVERIVDTVDALFRRRQIDQNQMRAAGTYRDAFDALTASIGGSLDLDRIRGGGSPGAPPAPAALLAADVLAEARRLLGKMDHDIVELVCGRGYNIEQTAERVLSASGLKKSLSERDVDHIGRRLREALLALAEEWFPVSRRSSIRGHIEDGAKPTGGNAGVRQISGRVAHAGEGSVRYSDDEKKK